MDDERHQYGGWPALSRATAHDMLGMDGFIAIVLDAAKDPVIADTISKRTKFAKLEDLAIHRSEQLTLLAGALPPGFSAGPHNHNLWSVVGAAYAPARKTINSLQGTATGSARSARRP